MGLSNILELEKERLKVGLGLPDVVSLGTGFLMGFSLSQNITPLDSKMASKSLELGSVLLQSFAGASSGYIISKDFEDDSYKNGYMILGGVSGVGAGLVLYTVGHSLGYTFGNLLK